MLDSELAELTQAAVAMFWSKRATQTAALADAGLAGGAARAGGHMDGICDVVRMMFIDAGMPPESIVLEPYLPGYYRARKRWDMAVRYRDTLVAAIEFKSQVGSVGKNINNRFEEALGSATDIWAAHTKLSAFGEIPPWLGYVFILQEDTETEATSRTTTSLFPADPAFASMSYNRRYQEMVSRFLADNIYQAGWYVTTKLEGSDASYAEPLAVASGSTFSAAIQARVALSLPVFE